MNATVIPYPHGYGPCHHCGTGEGRFCMSKRRHQGQPFETAMQGPHASRRPRDLGSPRQGMTAWIYVNACYGPIHSQGGISSQGHHQVLVVGENIPKITTERDGLPVVYLTETTPGYLVAEPADGYDPRKIGWMAGGSFIHSTDSRWFEITGTRLPIPLHDRQETIADYEALTR